MKVFRQPSGRLYKAEERAHVDDSELVTVSPGMMAVLREDKTMNDEEVRVAIFQRSLEPVPE